MAGTLPVITDLPGDGPHLTGDDERVGLAEGIGRGQNDWDGPGGRQDLLGA